jgi:hypothetical protein
MAECPSAAWERYIEGEEAAAEAEEQGRVDDLARRLWVLYFGLDAIREDNDWKRIERAAFDATRCGISFWHDPNVAGSVVVSGYCEGVDAECPPIRLCWPYTHADIDDAVKAADYDGVAMWNETHGCESCGPENDIGYRDVNPKCKACKGAGEIF